MNWAQTHSYLQINPQRRSKREAPPSPGDGGAVNDHCCCSCWCSSLDVPPDEAIRGAGDGSPGKARGPGGIFRCEKHPAGWIGTPQRGRTRMRGARPLYLLAHSRIGWIVGRRRLLPKSLKLNPYSRTQASSSLAPSQCTCLPKCVTKLPRRPNLAEEQFEHAHPRDRFGLGVRGDRDRLLARACGLAASVFPRFEAGSPRVHVKHGLAAAVAAVVLFAVAAGRSRA